ncbi:MAG TPA: hypothetical protein VGE07_12555 [Herpetosiphonaceae bacterium]
MRRMWTGFKALLGLVVGLACVVLLGVFFIGPAVAVEVSGLQAPGEVIGRAETISPLKVTWTRQMTLDVRYRPEGADADETARVAVDAETYDRLAVGGQVSLRYLRADGLFRQIGNAAGARLTSQGPFGSLIARYAALGPYLLGGLVCLALAVAWARWKRWWLAAPIFCIIAGGGLLVGSGWQRPPPAGEQLSAQATVRRSELIERVWGGKRTRSDEAVQPFWIVELAFVPAGRSQPVVAVDLIDDGSVPSLASGAELPIRYSAADPRRAQIEGATRSYVWKNLSSFGIIIALLGGLALATWVWRRRRRAASPGS